MPFLYLFFGLWLLGMIIDLRTGNLRWRKTPQFWLVVVFFVFASVTAVVYDPSTAIKSMTTLAVCVTLYFGIAHAVQSFRALEIVSGTVLAVVLFVCGVGTEQGFASNGCVVIDETTASDTASGTPDGRPCETARSCYQGDAEPEAEYMCERIGLFGTTSIGQGRVRYRGTLQDPNELALAGGAGLPLAFAFGRRRKSVKQGLLVALTLGLVGCCAVLTESRGGQLVFLAVLAVFFVKRFGFGGLAVGGVLALPLLVLGGRSGAEATSSTVERIDCWAEALSIWRSHPLTGVGLGRFGEFHYMTAHNSYLLTLAELGLPGMLLFTAIVYVSAKIPVEVLRRFPRPRRGEPDDDAAVARRWATAYLAAFAGLVVGIFFLSFAYHYVLWIYIGLAGALYSAVRAHAPWFRVRFRFFDALAVGLIDVVIIAAVYLYTHAAQA